MSEYEDDVDLFKKLSAKTRQREVELRRVIKRVRDGDTVELVRAVVEAVTSAMEDELCNFAAVIDNTDIMEKVMMAKFRAFKKETGDNFTTVTMRCLDLSHEIKAATKKGS